MSDSGTTSSSKILCVAPRFHANQIGWISAWESCGLRVEYWLARPKTKEPSPMVKFVYFQPTVFTRLTIRLFGRSGETVPNLWQVRRQLKALAPRCVLVRNPTEPFSFCIALVARLSGFPVVLYTQFALHQRFKPLRDRAKGCAISFFRAPWITPIRGNPKLYSAPHPDARFVPLVPPPGIRRRTVFAGDGKVRVLCVAKLMERKNHLLLLRAVNRLVSRFSVHLTLVVELPSVGKSELADGIRDYISAQHLEDTVQILEPMPHEQLLSTYAEYDLFVLPSSDEGFGMGVLEAMAAGLPVVASDTAGVSDCITHRDSGCIFQSDNEDDLVEQLSWLLSQGSRLDMVGGRAYIQASENYSPQRFLSLLGESLRALNPDSGDIFTVNAT